MDAKVQELLKQIGRMELAAKHGLELAKAPIPGIPAEKIISAEQCEWILKDCVLFRSAIYRTFGLQQWPVGHSVQCTQP